ncbi:HlyD family type I secretion periplasmic adaptor subunit [Thalassobaculum salexigens]|uniref:HlyD family type I secretion periplasmic adaptor subunit n=1 Tax=Thalassobaculum salexigens TaxID=455360 RepID=UPI0004903DC5|nr:HlyD family type I secretion periplasmic adaptor subunit [Thalassobaculum salexigens]
MSIIAHSPTRRLDDYAGPDPRRFPLILGMTLIFGIFGSMGLWAYFSEVDRGVRASGVLAITTPRQVVNSPVMGTVQEIFVDENDFVNKGEVLMTLKSEEETERFNLSRLQLFSNRARQQRFKAEYDLATSVDFSGIAHDDVDPSVVDDVFNEQRTLFEAGLDRYERERGILESQIVQIQNIIGGLQARRESVVNQMALIADEMDGMEELLSKGYIPKTRFLALKRASEGLKGELGQIDGDLSLRDNQILEFEKTLDQLVSQRRAMALDRLDKLKEEEDNLRFQVIAFEERMDQRVIVSPHDGYVLNLRVQNPGYVVSPGQAITNIVPKDDDVTIEAKVSTTDIGGLENGMPAEVRVMATGGAKAARRAPLLHGKVTGLSADTLIDPATGVEYYLAKVTVPAEEWQKMASETVPGMRADVLFRTGTRNVLDFLVSPISFVFEDGFTAR